MHGLLGFLLFAGACTSTSRPGNSQVSVLALALLSTLISTAVDRGRHLAALEVVRNTAVAREALLFGALISPTDPIAVLGIMRSARCQRPGRADQRGVAVQRRHRVVLFVVISAATEVRIRRRRA